MYREGVCSGSVRECLVCVRVSEGACVKVQCLQVVCEGVCTIIIIIIIILYLVNLHQKGK